MALGFSVCLSDVMMSSRQYVYERLSIHGGSLVLLGVHGMSAVFDKQGVPSYGVPSGSPPPPPPPLSGASEGVTSASEGTLPPVGEAGSSGGVGGPS